jgi:transcription-repair coupling factor (superfamily II helicase)
MNISRIKEKLYSSNKFRSLLNISEKKANLTGVNGSLISFIVSYLFENKNKKIVLLSYDNERLNKINEDLNLFLDTEKLSIFSTKTSTNDDAFSRTLSDITDNKEYIVLSHISELSSKIIAKDTFKDSLIELKKNVDFSFEELISKLNKYQYNQNDFVQEVGEYSVRGGIIDIFPENYETPIRIEFFGDTIESIREFDITNQRSIREIENIKLGINLTSNESENLYEPEKPQYKEETILDYLPEDTLIIFDEEDVIKQESKDEASLNRLENFNSISISALGSSDNPNAINFESKPQPDFYSNIRLLHSNLSQYKLENFDLSILCSDDYQCKRIKSLIEDFDDESVSSRDENIHKVHESDSDEKILFHLKDKFDTVPESFQSGFIFPDAKILVYTEHQIFGRYFKVIKKKKAKFKGITFEELKEIKLGDYIVHRDFGIGIFSGLKKINVGNNTQEVVQLSYKGGDTLFVNLNYIHLIKKYSGSGETAPDITKLGGGEWDKIKQRTKKRVKDIARDLILLYAKRKSEKGFKFSPDTHWQKELEASFMYEDTPDQYRATEEVKEDMQNENPMDRLVCGDVGFGKTEVAVRAAFKAVMDGKQVAVLVPTTILAVQHYNTFRDRLHPFAVDVECISRLKSKKEQKEIIQKLEEGKINILIGTHRLVSSDIKFKDIGLMIIDEEQRFGVAAKEKIKALKPNVDTLTLTATPIPRTLNFSLLGARDLSIINTPPKNRKPIVTEMIKLDWNKVAEVIKNELNRGGQVYFVNDKIQNLPLLADTIKSHIPSARIGIAHGQMSPHELEDVLVNFIEKKLNILLCTKIVESGLDITNVNTIIINNANMYGLAELYQLRGRVGRSDQQAYAYFVTSKGGKLTRNALRRLQAIEELTDLGSGFNLAMRDMEIRGVGNLLGKEQSGFINQVGFDLFITIIDEAVAELKDTEFKELFKEERRKKEKDGDETTPKKKETLFEKLKIAEKVKSTIIENDINALIPKDYVKNDTERLNIYRRLFDTNSYEELDAIKSELKDRFGEYLDDVENLMKIVSLKIKATEIGLEKITIRGKDVSIYFPASKEHPVFQSEYFNRIISAISTDKSRKFNISSNKEQLEIEIRLDSNEDEKRLNELKDILDM